MDKFHKANIAETIKKELETIDGILIIANGTLEKVGAATDYALRTLAGMFPFSIIDSIGFIFTNVADELAFNFKLNTLPDKLRNLDFGRSRTLWHCGKWRSGSCMTVAKA